MHVERGPNRGHAIALFGGGWANGVCLGVERGVREREGPWARGESQCKGCPETAAMKQGIGNAEARPGGHGACSSIDTQPC